MTSHEPEEPTFASPTPPGSLPAPDLDSVHLPGVEDAPDARPDDASPPGDSAAVRRVRRRAWIAVAALVAIAVVVTATGLGARGARARGWEPLPASLSEPREAHAVQLVLGSCLEALPDDGPVGRVHVVPCADEHEAEVVGRTDADADAVWPGDDTLVRRGSRACDAELLGSASREGAGGLTFVVWAPSEESWAAGDRTTLCLAGAPTPTTGSLLE